MEKEYLYQQNWEQKLEESSHFHGNYFRPMWICGRYERRTHSAILYNLLGGLNFFFEDDSADVIGEILSAPRGEQIFIEKISTNTGISIESLKEFFVLLEKHQLLSPAPMIPELIKNQRNIAYHSIQVQEAKFSTNIESSDAEKSYSDRSKSRVVFALLELTYKCSEACIHCYNPGASRNDEEKNTRNQFKELEIEDYKRIIDELYDEGVIRVCLSGGDPFSKSIVWDIIDYLYHKDIAFDIYTNGQNLFGKEKKLANYFPCAIGVSIYSTDANIHDGITRIKGSFIKSIKVLDSLSKYSIPICIKCCIMRTNLKTYLGVSDIAQKYKATLQLECAIFDSVDGDTCVSKYLRLNQTELELVLRDKNNPIYVGNDIQDYGRIKKDLDDIGCRAGIQNFCITPTGNLIPCCSYHASLGNLKEKHLAEILNSGSIKRLTSLKLKEYEECGQHDYCDFCQLCPGLNFAEHGTPLKAAENNCYIAKIRYNLANRLQEGNDPLNGKTLQEAINILPNIQPVKIRRIPTKNNFDKEFNI